MTAPASLTDLVTFYAQTINASGLAVFDPDRVWTSSDTDWAVQFGSLDQDPPKVIALNGYTVSEDPLDDESIVAVQLRIRGDEAYSTTPDMSAAIFQLFQGLQDVMLPSMHLTLAWRNSSLPNGPDDNDRTEWFDNYYNRVNWPAFYRTL